MAFVDPVLVIAPAWEHVDGFLLSYSPAVTQRAVPAAGPRMLAAFGVLARYRRRSATAAPNARRQEKGQDRKRRGRRNAHGSCSLTPAYTKRPCCGMP